MPERSNNSRVPELYLLTTVRFSESSFYANYRAYRDFPIIAGSTYQLAYESISFKKFQAL